MVIVIVAVLLIVSSILILVMRNRLKKESATFDDEISHALICPTNNSYELSKSKAISGSSQRFDDIETALAGMYDNTYISGADEEQFTNHFSNVFNEAYSLKRKLDIFHVSPSYELIKLISDYGSIHNLVKKHNDAIIERRLSQNKEFFDHCLTYPLDNQQRRSIVSEENNCLVVSSAGSGKTSSIVGKVKYLTEKLKVHLRKYY